MRYTADADKFTYIIVLTGEGGVPVAEVTVLDEDGNVVEKWSIEDGDTATEDGTVELLCTMTEKGTYTVIVKVCCGNETVQEIVEDRIDNAPPSADLGDAKVTQDEGGNTEIVGIKFTDEDDSTGGSGSECSVFPAM